MLLLGLLCFDGGDGIHVVVPEVSKRYPNEFEWIKRTYPHFEYDEEAYFHAGQEVAQLRAAPKKTGLPAWHSVGPTNIPGRISDIAFDPLNPGTVYAGSAVGGVYKSEDGGRTWTPIFDDQPTQSIGDISVDPQNTGTLYVGTGEANGGHNTMRGFGVYKSTDGGQSWNPSGLQDASHVSRILVSPSDPQRIYAASIGSYFKAEPDRGVYRSTNGGATWDKVLFISDSTGVIDLAMRPDNPDVLFAATWIRLRNITSTDFVGTESGIYRSVDGGTTWERLGVDHGLPVADGVGRIGLAICRDFPDTVYALFTGNSPLFGSHTYYGLYRSDDGGETWRDADPGKAARFGFRGFSWYFGQVRVAPDNPDIIYVLDVLMGKSNTGGATWDHITGTHVDYHALAFHPNEPETVLVGNDGGLAISTNRGSTFSFRPALANTQFYEIGLHPTNPNQFYGGTQDNGTLMSNGTDNWRRILGGDGFYVIVDPVDTTTVYAEQQFGVLVKLVFREDGGRDVIPVSTQIPSNQPRNWATPVEMDPHNHLVLYYGTDRIHRTADGARTWEEVSAPLVRPESKNTRLGTVTTIAVSPVDSSVVYAGTDDGNVWVSQDHAESWTRISDTLPRRWVTRVVPDPEDLQTAYVTYSGRPWRDYEPHVLRTRDLGATWDDITSNLVQAPVNAFAVDPKSPSRLFVGTDLGAFMSTDDGANWVLLADGLPQVPVYDMKIFSDDQHHILVAGTHGRSMYTLDLSTTATLSEPPPVPANYISLSGVYPNPFDTEITLEYTIAGHGVVSVEIYDLMGRRLQLLGTSYHSPGIHRTLWEASAVASGTYFARISHTGSQSTSTHTAVLRKH